MDWPKNALVHQPFKWGGNMYGALRCCYWYYCWTNFYRNWHRHSISSFVLWLINSISNNKSVSMKWYASSFYDNFPAKKFFNIFCCCCSDHLVMGHPVFFSGVWSILCSICKTQTPEEEKTSPGIVFGFGSVATSLAYTHKLKCKCVQREKHKSSGTIGFCAVRNGRFIHPKEKMPAFVRYLS